jgi:hypothetical protein
MVKNIREFVAEYEKRLQEMPFMPRSSYGRPMLREDGGPNSNFRNMVVCVNWDVSCVSTQVPVWRTNLLGGYVFRLTLFMYLPG